MADMPYNGWPFLLHSKEQAHSTSIVSYCCNVGGVSLGRSVDLAGSMQSNTCARLTSAVESLQEMRTAPGLHAAATETLLQCGILHYAFHFVYRWNTRLQQESSARTPGRALLLARGSSNPASFLLEGIV